MREQRQIQKDLTATREVVETLLAGSQLQSTKKALVSDVLPAGDRDVIIGKDGFTAQMEKGTLHAFHVGSSTKQDYVLKLVGHLFTEELAVASYNEGKTVVGTGPEKKIVEKEKLRDSSRLTSHFQTGY